MSRSITQEDKMENTSQSKLSFLMPLSGSIGSSKQKEPAMKQEGAGTQQVAPAEASGISSSADIVNTMAVIIVHNPQAMITLLNSYGASLSVNVTRMELKNVLMKKIAEQNNDFNRALAELISQQAKANKYSSIFGIDDIIGFIATLGSSSSGNSDANSEVTNQLIQLQAEKEKAARQQTMIGFGIFAAMLLAVGVVVVKTAKK